MVNSLYWLIHKDVLREFRTRQNLPATIVLGAMVAVVLTSQAGRLHDDPRQLCGGLLWVGLFFATLPGIERSCAAEAVHGCWEGLLAFPCSPVLIYWSKLLFNIVLLTIAECLLLPAFAVLTDVSLLNPLWPILLICSTANLAFAAVGTFLSAALSRAADRSQLFGVILLPMMMPILIAAAEATRLHALHQRQDDWWRWIQLLVCCGVMFATAGSLLFEFVVEE